MDMELGIHPPALARDNGSARGALPTEPSLPPLRVSGLVVAKADLVQAMRVYVPKLVDLAALDGESFVLTLTGANQ